jgi:hypothetical protein
VGRGDRGEAATPRDLDRPRELFVMLRQVRAVAAHPKAAAGQLLSIAIAMLASKPNNARIVKESPRFIWRVLP